MGRLRSFFRPAPATVRRHDRFASIANPAAWLLAAALPFIGSCGLTSSDFTISGRLESDFGCTFLATGSRSYELLNWRGDLAPLGSFATLRVRPHDGISVCMVGPMVDVVQVKKVTTDFRTAAVVGTETWGPGQGPIVLGKVEVVPGARLKILPGTTVQIIDYGELRVRGVLEMVGTVGDSVHFTGPGGPVVLDSVQTGTVVTYASLGRLTVTGPSPDLERVTVASLTVTGGSVTVRNAVISGAYVYEGTLAAETAELGMLNGIYGDFYVSGSTLNSMLLSYSRAAVTDSRFTGTHGGIVFHGRSSGSFERNTFLADETRIEVRHDSEPAFHHNDFVGAATTVICESYQLSSCIHMEENWWGTSTEEEIVARFEQGCPVCYVPWLTGPAEVLARR